ncbi:hypothetical protein M0812_21935 [Anaeramoeba flamelloides]|uniref:BTB domain-containing protein n=1 Tax=Anaeramoeba flamelloides TaxID=1746091 RepID=A0AAV7YT93_9EUKA|nr:hypothetical protein M0812_21935 [Anaeramoeba flamelloides]
MTTKKIKTFNQTIRKLYLSNQFSDLKLKVGKEAKLVSAHKLILSLSSEKLYRITEDKKILDLTNYTEQCIKEVLKFLYTKEFKITSHALPLTFQFAAEFECTELEMCCVSSLMDKLTTEMCLELFDLSQKSGIPSFEKKVKSMILENAEDFLTKKGVFNSLPLTKLYHFVNLLNQEGTDQMTIVHRLFEFKQFKKKGFSDNNSLLLFNQVRDLIRFNEINLKNLPEIRNCKLWTNEEILDLLSLGFSSSSSSSSSSSNRSNKNKNSQRKRNYDERVIEAEVKKTNKNLAIEDEENSNPILKQRRLLSSKKQILLITVQTKKRDLADITNSLTSGQVRNVTVKNPNEENITLEVLQQYQGVFIFSTSNYQNPEELGNALGEYWKLGGGIVICSVASLSHQKKFAGKLEGAIAESPILPVKKGVFKKGDRGHLGKVNFPSHPLMKGVKSWDGGIHSFRVTIEPIPQRSQVIAEWDDQTPLIVIRKQESENNGRLAILNLLPTSDAILRNDKRWNTNSDGRKIISNAISYVSHI